MENWKDYIEQKFIPKEDFGFLIKSWRKDGEKITIIHKKTKIQFEICLYSGGWGVIEWITILYKNTVITWSEDVPFIEEDIKFIDDILNQIFYDGTSIKEYYLFNKKYKTDCYYTKVFELPIYTSYANDYISCLGVLVFPVFIIINFLVRKKIIGDIKKIVVEPIMKT